MHSSHVSLTAMGGNFHPAVRSRPVPDDSELARAARNDAPILFTGSQQDVRALALRIHELSGWCWGPFLAIDGRDDEAVLEQRLFRVLEAELAPAPAVPAARLLQPGTLFLEEVGGLGARSQSRLRDLLGDVGTRNRRRGRRRLMASTSQPLIARVADGSFDDRLFYRLNRLHFVI